MSFSSRPISVGRTRTPSFFAVDHNVSSAEGKTAARLLFFRTASVSARSNLRAETLAVRKRLLWLLRVLAPALLLGGAEGGEDLADGALGNVAGDEHHAGLAGVALGPGVARGRRTEDVLYAEDGRPLVAAPG